MVIQATCIVRVVLLNPLAMMCLEAWSEHWFYMYCAVALEMSEYKFMSELLILCAFVSLLLISYFCITHCFLMVFLNELFMKWFFFKSIDHAGYLRK